MKFLVNPVHRKHKTVKRRSTTGRKKRSYTFTFGGSKMAKKRRSAKRAKTRRPRRRSVTLSINPHKKRSFGSHKGHERKRPKRRMRRNPSLVSMATRGVMDAVTVTAGKVATNLVVRQIPDLGLPTGTVADAVKGLVVALGVSWAGDKVVSGERARFISAGAFQSVVEKLIRGANIPTVSTALGEYDASAAAVGAGSYPAVLTPGVSSYPGIGSYGGDGVYARDGYSEEYGLTGGY